MSKLLASHFAAFSQVTIKEASKKINKRKIANPFFFMDVVRRYK